MRHFVVNKVDGVVIKTNHAEEMFEQPREDLSAVVDEVQAGWAGVFQLSRRSSLTLAVAGSARIGPMRSKPRSCKPVQGGC